MNQLSNHILYHIQYLDYNVYHMLPTTHTTTTTTSINTNINTSTTKIRKYIYKQI